MRRFLLLCLLILVGCRADGPNPTEEPPTLPPDTPTTLAGVVSPLFASDSVGGRALALCVVESRLARFPLACEPTGLRTTTAPDGSFRFQNIPPARYAVLVDSGLGDFSAALDTWRGAILRPGDWEWVQQTYLGLAPAESTHLNLPGSFPVPLDQAGYAVDTLSLGDSPFIVAHRVAAEDGTVLVHPIVADLTRTRLVEISFPVGTPEPLDRAAIREAVGPLTREDLRWVDPQVADRWTRFTNGDDTAFRDTDARLIAALRTGAIHPIGGTTFTTVEQGGGRLLKWMAYRVVDVDSGEEQIVGHVDPITGDVIEAVSGYRLNVLDPPGEWITPGPNGEQIYHYGFSYYRRWERILPDPVIAMVERFYTQGASHVRRWSDLYQTADATFGGDLSLVAWDTTLPNRIAGFNPSTLTPPTLYLPDSGTVDVDRGRFLQAMIDGQVTVDRDSVMAFYNSDFARENPYIETLDPQDVIDALLTPYRSGHLFNDMEAAVILAATYGEQPLEIVITPRVQAGFMVPRRTPDRVLISSTEVGEVILGYGGTLNARWPHEMAHIVEFRAAQYEWQGQPNGVSGCEPLKYMMEFMWWVERYPYDAPDDDWMPIGSGLTLARLLTGTYPNSGC